MSDDTLKHRLQEDMKAAMRAKEQIRLMVIRMARAAIKKEEIDSQQTLDDAAIIAIMSKMIKQRQEAVAQYDLASRKDLADKERAEIVVLRTYMPAALSAEELEQIIQQAIAKIQATQMSDMGKVMAVVKPKVQGRADMRMVSEKVKQYLGTVTK